MRKKSILKTKKREETGITEENVDKLIEVFHSRGRKKEPWQVLIQIVSTAHFLGGGSYLAALAQCGEGGRVWHYSTAFDTPIPGEEKLACAWHGADQPLTFRAVYYKKAEPVSEFMAHSFAAFAKTGNPETENIKWPSFDRKRRETMIFDVKTKWEEDPYRDIYRAVAQVSPSFTRMMSGVEWIESPRCKKQEGVS